MANTGRAAVAEFAAYLETEKPNVIQHGTVYDPENGWRVMQRVGDKALFFSPGHARRLADDFRKRADRPEWRHCKDFAYDQASELLSCAREAETRNQSGYVPEGYAEAMPTKGTA